MRYSFASPQGFSSPSSLKTSNQHSSVNIGVLKHLRLSADHRRGRRCHTSIATPRPSARGWVTLGDLGWKWVYIGGRGRGTANCRAERQAGTERERLTRPCNQKSSKND